MHRFGQINVIGFALLVMSVVAFDTTWAAPVQQPNIILINLDDADTEMFSNESLAERFPNLFELSSRSVYFNNTHSTTPLCGPSRACLLRAQYAHRSEIRVNLPDVPKAYGFDGGMRSYVQKGYTSNDLSTWMQDAGYHTMQVGKYLHENVMFLIPEGWDDFYSSVGGRYYATHRITNRGGTGPQVETLAPGVYRTNAEADDAVELINRRANASDGKPFFLYLNPFGPHVQQPNSGEMYEERYADLWPDAQQPESASYNEADVSHRAGPLGSLPPLAAANEISIARQYRERLLAMKSVDDMVGDVVNTLKQRGLEDNTWIFVTSDNGFALGQNRIIAKGVHVESATHIPLMVTGPGVNVGVSDHLLAHIDIGPTIVQLAGGQTPDFVDGVSFAPLIANPQREVGVRDRVVIENFEARRMFGEDRQFASTGLRFKEAIYIEWASGGREYFNLRRDPEQLQNLYADIPLQTRKSLAIRIRQSKTWSKAKASFYKPYYDLEELGYPRVLQGIAESTISTRFVKLAVRDLSTGNFWDGSEWVSSFRQVEAKLGHQNGQLTTWSYTLDFGEDKPAGLVKAWAWGLDWGNSFDDPDSVVFRLGEVNSSVSLVSPSYAQRFSNAVNVYGSAISGDDPELERIELRIRDIETGKFWTGETFNTSLVDLEVERSGDNWSYISQLPPGSYRVSVAGIDHNGNRFNETHRLFHVDP